MSLRSPASGRRRGTADPGRLPVLLIALLAFCTSGCAPSSASRAPAVPAWPSDEAAIRNAVQASADAWNRGDLKAHLSFYSDSVTFMTQSGPRVGVAGIEQSFQSSYFRDGLPRQSLRFEQVAVRSLDDDAALATGRFVLSGGGEPEQSGWFSLVWVRTVAGWKAIHDHSS